MSEAEVFIIDDPTQPIRLNAEQSAVFRAVLAAARDCPGCKATIDVGRGKSGRTVFKGGICHRCWVRAGKPGRAKK